MEKPQYDPLKAVKTIVAGGGSDGIKALGLIVITVLTMGALLGTGQPPLPIVIMACIPVAGAFGLVLLRPKESQPHIDGKTWKFLTEKMEKLHHSDFLISRFVCPHEEPVEKPELNEHSIYYLWADPAGSEIIASLDVSTEPVVDVRFKNSQNAAYPVNLAIRPGGLSELRRRSGQNFICFEARVCQSGMKRIALSFRLIDELKTHWVRRRGPDVFENQIIELQSDPDKWCKVTIPLNDKCWQVFGADGNHLYHRDFPIFDLILAIVIEMGEDRRKGRPNGGEGHLQFKNFYLSDRG